MNDFSNFFKKNKSGRLDLIREFSKLTKNELLLLEKQTDIITFERANEIIENVIGVFSLPLGIATNFMINNKKHIIPMVIEEPSVVAAASKAAKIALIHGGFKSKSGNQYSVGQIYVVECGDVDNAVNDVNKNIKRILRIANLRSYTLSKIKKGAKNILCRKITVDSNVILVIELVIDVNNAMGANVTNSMCEAIAPLIEKLTHGHVLLKILTNYYTKRIVNASAIFDKNAIGGDDVVNKIILAYKIAVNDKYRAVTHNKGIMNGIIAVSNATCQDTRAIEATVHAFASRTGNYQPLTKWKKDINGNLLGTIELPLPVGTVGGIINTHPMAKLCLKIINAVSSSKLACIMASIGLAQNFAALYALVTEGIQKGHMRLHAKNIAASAGVKPDKIDIVVKKMIKEGNISVKKANVINKKLA